MRTARTLILLIFCLMLVDICVAQISPENSNYIIIDSTSGFSTSNWRHSAQKTVATITAFNYSFQNSYKSAIGNIIVKEYILTLFVLPDEQNITPVWVVSNNLIIEDKIISTSKLKNIVLKAINNAKQFPTHTSVIYDVKPIIKRNGQYYITKNPTIGQCWEVINKKIEHPSEATVSTINIGSNKYSKKLIEIYKDLELKKLKSETNSLHPIGENNILSDYVFLSEIDSTSKIFKFWYTPAEVFDGDHWSDGIIDFMYSPCYGIVGGSFKSYFRSLKIDPNTFKTRYDGYYRAYQIDSINADTRHKNCVIK